MVFSTNLGSIISCCSGKWVHAPPPKEERRTDSRERRKSSLFHQPVWCLVSKTEKITNLANARMPFSSMFPSSQNAWKYKTKMSSVWWSCMHIMYNLKLSRRLGNLIFKVILTDGQGNLTTTWEGWRMWLPHGRCGEFEYYTMHQLAAWSHYRRSL